MSKPTMSLVKASTKGKIRYSPCEIQDEKLKQEHQRFRLEPMGAITDFPRHIPYSSEKKSFQERTGRDAFEAFHYSFRMPGENTDREPHVVMWDYNVGLVRITSFFKSLRHPKTMPAKVMTANPGLKEISHSITGGSISAQGYWIPYEAAKAIAARFCWEIRYALTPVFGVDFPSTCIKPGEPTFLKLNINKSIVERCTELADGFRLASYEVSAKKMRDSSPTSAPKSFRPKPVAKLDYESGYGTDSDRSLVSTPRVGSHGWTAVNAPKITATDRKKCRTVSPAPSTQESIKVPTSRVSKLRTKKRLLFIEDEEEASGTSEKRPAEVTKGQEVASIGEEARAAYALMALWRADQELREKNRIVERRASWS